MSEVRKTRVLFLCIGNMCRSPMAEGFAHAVGSDVLEPYSAGVRPTGVISEDAIEMMDEKGVDISHLRSKGLISVPLDEIEIVVSMVGRPARRYLPPNFRGRVVEWGIDDPVGRSLDTFRRVRDEIEGKVRDLASEIRARYGRD